MRYDEFRDRLQSALVQAGLLGPGDGPGETIELGNSSRHWQVVLHRSQPRSSDPFYISAKIGFAWSPADAARANACEEELLANLFGMEHRSLKTGPRSNRIDLELRAALPAGSAAPLPDAQTFHSWAEQLDRQLGGLWTEFRQRRGRPTVTGGLGNVKLSVECKDEGLLSLGGLTVSGFRIVRVPRRWENPDRHRAEKDLDKQLALVARQFGEALQKWTRSIGELFRWIRYAPPAEEANLHEPWLEDTDGGSETVH